MYDAVFYLIMADGNVCFLLRRYPCGLSPGLEEEDSVPLCDGVNGFAVRLRVQTLPMDDSTDVF